MWTVFRYALRRYRGQILGWGLAMAALGLLLIPFYDVFAEEQTGMQALLESYPPEIMAFFGGSVDLLSPAGFLDLYLSYLPAVVGIFTLMAGSGLIASDEESGRLDLVLAHPVSRSALFWGRFLAFVAATAAIMVLSWLGYAIPLGGTSLDVTWGEMALPFLSLLAHILVYGTLALLASLLVPARRLAGMIAGLVMVASYFLTALGRLDDRLEPVARLLPFDYYQGGSAVDGLNLAWFFGLLAVSALFTLVAWWLFLRRDIRIGGEGGWQIPFLRNRLANTELLEEA